MREMESLTSLEEVNAFIQRHPLAFLYISSTDCSVCHALYPQIQRLMIHYPEIRLGTVNAQEVTEIAGSFSVFTVPVLLLFVEGKEYVREARIVHLDLLDEKIKRVYENVI
ncbi:thioredoxin family protein [Paenibacillus sp. SC116]|uniref:thioredoxin family protein n=1 Tax=Paenibacillus sp. SC116 TaxID=2968986 RepID=UPI00215A278A|nr:thioredoxin family protein [Paenibacillus sp. SC116]MCR8844481.1 thioredoxin family protein [Paenibacillus sp. SC116]